MVDFQQNSVAVFFKLFNSPEGMDLIAVVFPPEHVPAERTEGLLMTCNGRVLARASVRNERYAKHFQVFDQPHSLAVAPLRDVPEVEDIRLDELTAPRLTFEVLDAGGGRLGDYLHAIWLPDYGMPLPPDANIDRVAGRVGALQYRFGGGTFYAKLLEIHAELGGKLEPASAILDWGCGCGRVARHFLRDGFTNLRGVDIDPVNIEWSLANLGSGFETIRVDPPTPFPDNSFDFVYGHSVFTHLREIDQFKWLGELHRIMKPGARAYVTIVSDNAVRLYGGLKRGTRRAKRAWLAAKGFLDIRRDEAGVDCQSPGYYRFVAHTSDYVRRRWSHYFEVERVAANFVDAMDLVVLAKR